MHKASRDLLRGIAQRYGVSQSEIMNVAPFAYIVLAERSLRQRERDLAAAHALAEQARRCLSSMARHFVLGDADEVIEQALGLEEQSLSRRQVHGPNDADIEDFTTRGWGKWGDPFVSTLEAALEEVGAKATLERYRSILAEDDDDTFVDEETEAMRAAVLANILAERRAEDLAQEAGEQDNAPGPKVSNHHSGPRVATWTINLRDNEIVTDTGADALESVLKAMVALDASALPKLEEVRGRVRPLIANSPDLLYPGRADLAPYSREFTPGWFVGTNYSHIDVLRLIRAAAEALGMVWGLDIYVRCEPQPAAQIPHIDLAELEDE
jgi:hypothetical protein